MSPTSALDIPVVQNMTPSVPPPSSSVESSNESGLKADLSAPCIPDVLRTLKQSKDVSDGDPDAPARTLRSDLSPSRASVRSRTLEATARMLARYRPRPIRGDVTPLELRFAARTTGPSSHLAMSMEDVEEGKALLLSALAHMPPLILKKVYEAKRAHRDAVAHRVALTAAEIEAVERHKDLLVAVHTEQEGELAAQESLLEVLKSVLDPRSLHDLEDDSGCYRAVFADELVALTVAGAQLDQTGSLAESDCATPTPFNDTGLPTLGLSGER